MTDPAVVRAWEEEYRSGRYRDEPPVPFVDDIVRAARAHGLGRARGLYIGCGNGRNYLPLVAEGLDLVGLDVSRTALAQLGERAPERASHLVCGDLAALPAEERFPIVIAIQVLQHGSEAATHAAVTLARERVAPGGLFCVRVNATGSEPEYAHERTEHGDDGRWTVRYSEGPKRGLEVHFFSAPELTSLVGDGFAAVLPIRAAVMVREAPGVGRWVQWEGIWRRNRRPDARPGTVEPARPPARTA
jgi:hypothetical protein